MKKLLARLRGALRLAVAWALGWSVVLSIATVVIDLIGGYPWTPTLPNLLANAALFGALGFLGGASFSVVLGIAGRRRRFEELSLPAFTGWGAIGGIGLGVLMSLTSGPASVAGFVSTVAFGALLGAGSAGGSFILATKADDRHSLAPGEATPLIEGE